MPLVTNQGVNIPFNGDADNLVKESQRVVKELGEIKEHSRRMSEESIRHAKAMEDAAKKQTTSWTEFRSMYSTVLDVVRAGKAVWDFAQEGAQLEFTRQKFDNLSVSIGTTSEALLGDLKEATRGMYSDMKLVESATDFVGLGLAKDHDEAVRLASVSAGLNMNMNQLVLTLTNMTTMRFDALGVRVDGFKERVDKLKESGLSADAAFKEAFLQQAEEQLKLVGNAADTAAGEFMRAEAEWENFTNSLKEGAAKAVAPVVSKINDINEESKSTMETLNALVDEGLIPVGTNFRFLSEEQKSLIEQYKNGEIAIDDVNNALQENTDALEENQVPLQLTEEQIKAITKANHEYLSMVGNIAQQHEEYGETVEKLNTKHAELLAEKQRLISQGYHPEGQTIQEVNEKIRENQDAMREAADEFEEAGRRRILSMLEQQLSIDGLDARETEYLLSKGLEWGIYSQSAVQAAREAQEEVRDLTAALTSLPTESSFTYYINTVGALPGFNPQAAPGGYGYGYSHAAGGSFMIPNSVGNEQARFPGGNTASGGERVTITPQNQDMIDYKKMARAFVQAMAQAGG
jgi:uncharacterized protein YoaH (UPF0181 family)